MKKIILFLLLAPTFLICYPQSGSFLDTNKLWSVLRYPYYKWPNHYTHFLKIGKDTTMNDTVFSKLLRCDEESQTNWYEYGYLREDSTGKVFYRVEELPPEGLIYYDSAEVGDTLNVAYRQDYRQENELRSFDLIVRSVDSIELNGKYYRKINLETEQWFVGIGAKSGLIYNYTGIVGGDSYSLLCYKYYDTLVYKRASFDNCYDVLNNINEINQVEINVYPNPSKGRNIKVLFPAQGDYQLQIFNYTGCIVIKKDTRDSRECIINTKHLKPGIYFMTISDHSEIMFNEKIIIF